MGHAAVLELTDLLGRRVVAGELELGRLADLAVRIDEPYPPVTRLLVGRGHRHFPWSAVLELDGETVRLEADAGELDPGLDRELLLREDVLDCQIFDFGGKRLTRVGDVELALGDRTLRVFAVDVGAAPIFRRCGLRSLARRLPARALDWEAIHLASARGHAFQLANPSAPVHRLSADQVARLVSRLPAARGAEVLRVIEPAKAAKAKRALAERHPPRHRFRKVLSARKRAPA